MKKFLAILISLAVMLSCLPISAFADVETNETIRYSVLVLDVCGKAEFLGKNDNIIYTADSAIDYVKESAKTFLSDLINAKGENYVAVVTYSDNAKIVSDFTNDINSVTSIVDSLSSNSSVRNLSDGLDKADSLLSSVSDNAIKNVVLVTTGMVNEGDYSYDGIYNEGTVGSIWRRTNTQVRLYAYANSAYERTLTIKEKANLYVLGLFQTMEGMPEEGKDIAQFFRNSAKDFASSEDTFFEIEDPGDIGFYFGEVSDNIVEDDIESLNVYNHIDFINKNWSSIYGYANSDVFNRVNHIARLDDGVLARESAEILKYYLNIMHISDPDSVKNIMGELSNSELFAQIIITDIMSSDEFRNNTANAGETGVDIADEQLLSILNNNTSDFSVSEEDQEQIKNLLNTSNKSSDEYIAKRNTLLDKYYASERISNSVSWLIDGTELWKTYDDYVFKYAEHALKKPKGKVLALS